MKASWVHVAAQIAVLVACAAPAAAQAHPASHVQRSSASHRRSAAQRAKKHARVKRSTAESVRERTWVVDGADTQETSASKPAAPAAGVETDEPQQASAPMPAEPAAGVDANDTQETSTSLETAPAEETSTSLVQLHGSVRTLPVALYRSGPAPDVARTDGTSLTQLRLGLKASTAEWNAFEVQAVQIFAFSTLPTPSSLLAGLPPPRYRLVNLTRDWATTSQASFVAFVDRLNLRLSIWKFDITIGRQVVNFSKAYFWSPLDVFLPFTPSTIDREYRPGIDALRVDLTLGELTGLNVIVALGTQTPLDPVTLAPTMSRAFVGPSWNASAALLRGYTTLGDWDLSLQGGSVYGGYHVGASVAGELLTLGIRAEVAFEVARTLPLVTTLGPDGTSLTYNTTTDHVSAVISVDRRFDNGLYINAEYFYNGAVNRAPFPVANLRVQIGETPSMGLHMVGLLLTYELLPTLKLRLAAISSAFSLDRRSLSAIIVPGFEWSAAENVDLQAGAIVAIGAGPSYAPGSSQVELRSEFGSYTNAIYALFRYYFGT